MKPVVIDSSTTMDEALPALMAEEIMAVDTEFFRETTYYPKLALIQIATASTVLCIDPLAFDAREPLRKIFLEKEIKKVFHSCSQDIEVLYYYLGKIPVSIYDTQIAHALLSEDHQIAYATLVEKELGVKLDKSQTRTNWLKRPLSSEQIQYAGDDVYYLLQLNNILEKKLQHAGRMHWYREDCQNLTAIDNDFQVNTGELWKRVKGSTGLNRDKLAIVQAIAEWREKLAQKNNKTRRSILADHIIIKLSLDPPEKIAEIIQIPGNKFRLDNSALQQLLHTINTARQSLEENWPVHRFNNLNKQQKSLLKDLQKIVNHKAAELGVSTAILCSRKELESLIISHTSYPQSSMESGPNYLNILKGWRLQCIGQELLEVVKTVNNCC